MLNDVAKIIISKWLSARLSSNSQRLYFLIFWENDGMIYFIILQTERIKI